MTNFAMSPQRTPLNLAYNVQWEQQYQSMLRQFLAIHDEFDGSAVAAWMRKKGLHDPGQHNMWGTQIKHYANEGWYTPIGKCIPSGAAHISQVRLWKSNFYRRPRKVKAGV